jgi:hypothetical protein
MRSQGKDNRRQNRCGCATGRQPPAIRPGAPGKQHRHGDGQEFKQNRELGLRRSSAKAAEKKRPKAEHAPGLAGRMQNDFFRSQRSRKGCSDESEHDDGNSNQGQIAQHRLCGRARPAQTGIDERHAGNRHGRKQQKSEC